MASKQNELESLVREGKSIIRWDGICFNKYFQSVYMFQNWYMEIDGRLNRRKGFD